VFIPRPETEHLVDLAIAELAQRRMAGEHATSEIVDGLANSITTNSITTERLVIIDLCAGSGAIGLSIATEVEAVEVTAVELSSEALPWLCLNYERYAEAIELAGSCFSVMAGDATMAAELLASRLGQVDVVTCNPPYIPDQAIPRDPEVRDFDPHMALYGGADGLDVVRGIVGQAAQLLRPGGLLLIEHSDQQGVDAGQLSVPGVLSADRRFADIRDSPDLTGRPRVTVARRSIP
jgi:release factor glutamine methyltransferase